MAEVIAKFDTVSKDLVVTIDGKAVADVDCVTFDKRTWDGEGDDYYCRVCTVSEDANEGTRTITQVVASATAEAKTASPSEAFPGFSVKASVAADKQIAHLASLLGA